MLIGFITTTYIIQSQSQSKKQIKLFYFVLVNLFFFLIPFSLLNSVYRSLCLYDGMQQENILKKLILIKILIL